MPEEEIEMGSGAGPEVLLPHELLAGATPDVMPEATPEPMGKETPLPDAAQFDQSNVPRIENEDGSTDITVPTDPEELDKFMADLSPSELADFRKNYLKEDIDPEDAHPTVDKGGDQVPSEDPDGQPDLEHDISQELYDSIPEDAKTYLNGMKERLDDLAVYESESYKEGMDKFMADPVVANRYKVLTGEVDENGPKMANEIINADTLRGLKLNFEFDETGSVERLKGLLANAVGQAEQRVHNEYFGKNQQSEFNRQLESELTSIQTLDPNLASDLKFNDPNHPMGDFMKWLTENEKNVNLVGLGGVNTYNMWKTTTGQDVANAASNATKSVVRNIARAKSQAARTIPKSIQSKGNSDKEIVHGIDVKRFQNDDEYNSRVWQQHGHDAKMRKTLNSWSY